MQNIIKGMMLSKIFTTNMKAVFKNIQMFIIPNGISKEKLSLKWGKKDECRNDTTAKTL